VFDDIWAITIDPSTPRTIFAGSTTTFYRSTDGGDHWSQVPFGLPTLSIAVSPSAPSTLYIATSAGVVKTNSGGDPGSRDWTFVNTGLPKGYVMSVAVDPTNAAIAYAATNAGVFKTTSGGSQWFSVLNVPATAIAVPAAAAARVYVGASGGMFASMDGGTTWTAKLEGELSTLGLDPTAPATVYAGSFGQWDAFVTRISADGSTFEYSTFLGGRSFDYANHIALDSSGNAYVVGATSSRDFPVANAAQPMPGGGRDVFAAKISPDGAVSYATFIGGSETEDGAAIAVDSAGRAHVAGYTFSANFPTRHAYQPTIGGGSDAFVTTLDSTGTAVEFATFLGGSGSEMGPGSYIVGRDPGVFVAVTPSGETLLAGVTASRDFPVLRAIQPVHGGGLQDAFVAKLDADGLLQFASYLGGAADDLSHGLALATDGSALIAGFTTSTNFPVRDPLQSANAGSDDAFMARIAEDTPDGTPPSTTIAVSGVQGAEGWYRSPPIVALSGSDPDGAADVAFIDYRLNGGTFARYGAPVTISSEGVSEITARATDQSGAVEAPLASMSIRIDTMAPSVAITSPEPRAYLHSDVLTLTFSARDDASGLAAGGVTAEFDGQATSNGAAIALLGLSLGTHALVVSAADVVGHAAQQFVGFTIVATIDSLIAAVNTYRAQGQMDATVGKSLLMKLNDAQAALDRGNLTAARGSLRDFIDQCSAKTGKGITAAAASVLIADAQFVIATF
jgi:FIMAH domain-containing protein/beta-propeller repeat-containing protein